MLSFQNIKDYIISIFAILFVLLVNNSALAIEKENIFPSQNCLEVEFVEQTENFAISNGFSDSDFSSQKGYVRLGGVECVGKVVSNATESSTQGGLNLFKWGAPQTGKNVGWKTGDYMLHLPNKGTPKLNWKANYGSLRREMGLNKPIFDSYKLTNGNLIQSSGFLGAERFTLQSRGWIYHSNLGAWIPPGLK